MKEKSNTKEKNPEEEKRKVLIQTFSGMMGALTIQLLHPFDLLKARFQSHDSGPKSQNVVPKYNSVLHSLKTILKEEGPSAFFRGAGISFVGNQVSYALFFGLYEISRQKIIEKFKLKNEFFLSFCASTVSAIVSSMLVQPIWMLKTRRLLDEEKGNDLKMIKKVVKDIKKDHGFFGFYRGFSLSLALSLYGTVQVTSYSTLTEKLKKIKKIRNKGNFEKLDNIEITIIGMVSRLNASLILHPLTTIRTRYQQRQFLEGVEGQKYLNVRDVVEKTWKNEGFRGFYKGVVPMTLRSMPSQGLFFLAYENSKRLGCGVLGVDYSDMSKK